MEIQFPKKEKTPKREFWQLDDDRLKIILNKLPEKGKILDLGCHNGKLLKQLQDSGRNYELFGIDRNENEISIAEKSVPSGNFQIADILENELLEKFDIIFAKFF